MAIVINLDVMLAKRKMSSLELAQRIGMTQANLSILKTGKAKAGKPPGRQEGAVLCRLRPAVFSAERERIAVRRCKSGLCGGLCRVDPVCRQFSAAEQKTFHGLRCQPACAIPDDRGRFCALR